MKTKYYKTIINPKTKEKLKLSYHILKQIKVKNKLTYEMLIEVVKGFNHHYGTRKCNNSTVINKKITHNPYWYNYLYSIKHNLSLLYDSRTKVVITMFHLNTDYYCDYSSKKWYCPIKKKW